MAKNIKLVKSLIGRKKDQIATAQSLGLRKIELVKSLNGRLDKHIATANSLGLRRIGQTTVQPDNAQTQGKINKISHLIEVTEA